MYSPEVERMHPTNYVAGGIQASGGVISDYPVGNKIYRAHVFTSSGTFDVSSIGGYGSNVEYLVVAWWWWSRKKCNV